MIRGRYIFRFLIDVIFLLLPFVYFNNSLQVFVDKFEIQYFGIIFIIPVIWFFVSKYTRLFADFLIRPISEELLISIYAIIIFSFIISFILFVSTFDLFNLRKLFISYSFSIAILIPVEKYLYRFVYTRIPINKTRSAKAIIVGSGKLGTHFFEFVNKTRLLGINIVGFLDDDCFSELRDLYIGTISDLPEILTDTSISDILIAIPSDQVDRIEYVKKISDENARRVRVIPDYFKSDSIIPLEKFLNSPLLSIRNVPLDDKELRLLKRIFDFIFSLLFILLIASWLFPLIALLIKLSSRGPVFFKQERWGINNSRMSCYKFRTMYHESGKNEETDSYRQAIKGDLRITKVGRMLRKSNIDEFPQFINVLKGEMSVVGPRPHPTALNEISKNQVNHYMLRHLVKPGITGWAQVNGFRGETSDVRLMRKRVELDIWYIENWSFRLDIQIIFQTIINMLKGDRNAY